MFTPKKNPVLLMVDDDDEDIYLTKRAFCDQRDDLTFRSVRDGSELFDYLNCRGKFDGNDQKDRPDIVLLDINIPKDNGFVILEKLRNDPQYGHLPVSMLTTSAAAHDVRKAYQLGASSFICKSVNPGDMKEVAGRFCDYWFGFAQLPSTV